MENIYYAGQVCGHTGSIEKERVKLLYKKPEDRKTIDSARAYNAKYCPICLALRVLAAHGVSADKLKELKEALFGGV